MDLSKPTILRRSTPDVTRMGHFCSFKLGHTRKRNPHFSLTFVFELVRRPDAMVSSPRTSHPHLHYICRVTPFGKTLYSNRKAISRCIRVSRFLCSIWIVICWKRVRGRPTRVTHRGRLRDKFPKRCVWKQECTEIANRLRYSILIKRSVGREYVLGGRSHTCRQSDSSVAITYFVAIH